MIVTLVMSDGNLLNIDAISVAQFSDDEHFLITSELHQLAKAHIELMPKGCWINRANEVVWLKTKIRQIQ